MAASTGSNNTAVGRQAGITSGTGTTMFTLRWHVRCRDENEHTYIRNITLRQ